MKTSIFKAVNFLSIKKVLVFTAYKKDMNNILKSKIESEDIEVICIQGLGLDTDYEIYNVSEELILRSLLKLKSKYCKQKNIFSNDVGIIVSCSALNMMRPGFIDFLEEQTGMAIISSTQAFCWNILRSLSINKKLVGFGRLFQN